MFELSNLMSKNGLFAFLIIAIIVAVVVWYTAFGGKEKCEKKKAKGENKGSPQKKEEENQEDQEIQDLADEINDN